MKKRTVWVAALMSLSVSGMAQQVLPKDVAGDKEYARVCKEYELKAGESILVDTGYLAAMSESCDMDIQSVKGFKNVFLGGEGLFHTRITGPGKVYIQSMPVINTAKRLAVYLPSGSSSSSSDHNDNGIHLFGGRD